MMFGISLSDAKRLNPDINEDLFLPSPKDVLASLSKPVVKDWLSFIANEHEASGHRYLVFVPCGEKKPYDPPRSELYRRFISFKADVYWCAVSEPLGLEPREYWGFRWRGYNLIYDAPFFPWIERYGYEWDDQIAELVWDRLSEVVRRWFERNGERFEEVIAFLCPGSGYREIIKDVPVDKWVPDECPTTEESYEENTSRVYLSVWYQLEKAIYSTNSE